MDIRNIYCIGRNYRLHAAELGNEVPSSPMLFLKPSHAAVPLRGGMLSIPMDKGPVHYESELVFYADKPYENGMTPDRLFSHMTVGLDLTLRSVQDALKAKGHPWLAAKGFRSSAPLGGWLPYPGMAALADKDFGMRLNGREVQRGNVTDMVFGLDVLVEFVGRTYGIGPGDILFTGTPAGVGTLSSEDELELLWDESVVGRAKVASVG